MKGFPLFLIWQGLWALEILYFSTMLHHDIHKHWKNMARAAVATCQVHRAIRGQRRRNYLVNSTTLHTRDSSHIRSHIWTGWRGLQGKGWQWKQEYIHVDNLKGLIIWNYLFGYAVTKYNPKTTLAIWYMTDCLSSFVKQVKGEGVDLHTWNPNTYEAEAGVLHDQIGLHTALESLLGYRARLYLNKSKLMNRMRKRW